MKKLALGCGIALVLLAVVIAAILLALPKMRSRLVNWAQAEKKVEEDAARFEATWKAPTPEPGERWFPEEVAGWKRTAAEPFHEMPELPSPTLEDSATRLGTASAERVGGPGPGGVVRDGYGATYLLGGRRIEVKVIPATELEQEGLMGRARGFAPRQENRGSTSTSRRGKVLEMKFGDRERIYVRAIRDWFIFLHTVDGAELQAFADSWMSAIDQQPAATPAATPTPAQ